MRYLDAYISVFIDSLWQLYKVTPMWKNPAPKKIQLRIVNSHQKQLQGILIISDSKNEILKIIFYNTSQYLKY